MNRDAFLEGQRRLSAVLLHVPTYSAAWHQRDFRERAERALRQCTLRGTFQARILEAVVGRWAADSYVKADVDNWRWGRTTRNGLPAVYDVHKAIVGSVEAVSYPTFLDKFRYACSWARAQLGDVRFCCVLDEPTKSTTWLANIAWDMGMVPYSLAYLPTDRGYSRRNLKMNVGSTLTVAGVRDFVYYDDAAYTGQQVGQKIVDLAAMLDEAAPTEKPTLYLVIPFVSQSGADHLLKVISGVHTMRVVLYPSFQVMRNLPTILGLLNLTSAQLQAVYEGLFYHGKPANTNSLTNHSGFLRMFLRTTLTYFEHKNPDNLSFPDLYALCMFKSAHETPYKRPEAYADTFPQAGSRTPKVLT